VAILAPPLYSRWNWQTCGNLFFRLPRAGRHLPTRSARVTIALLADHIWGARTFYMNKSDVRMTVPKFVACKADGRKITVLTAYDHTMAAILDAAGIEAVLVGDTLSM